MTSDAPPAPQRSPLTPHAALGWLHSLSVDIEAAAVLDAGGVVLAGDPALARTGPKAIERLVRADLQTALQALETH
jgi:hypothetical protein